MAGGLLLAGFGLGAPWIALAGLYLLSIGALLVVPDVRPAETVGKRAWTSVVEGLRYVRRDPLVSRIMFLAFTVIAPMAIFPVLPIYARDRFGVGETGFGTMMAFFAVGQGLSAIYVTIRGGWERKVTPVLTSAAMWAIFMVVLGFSRSYPLTLFALFMLGAGIPPWITSVSTILQTHSDKEMLGRVMAVFAMSFQVAFVGWFVGGWLGELIGNDWMLLWMGVAYLTMNAGVFATSKELRAI
jgi:MFS family permease